MEINKQLFEDVLSGKLKGTFVFRNQLTCNSDELTRNTDGYKSTHPYYPYSIKDWSYTQSGHFFGEESVHSPRESNVDIVDFIPDTDMKENELTIEIPDGKIVDWDESKKQDKIVFKKKDTKPVFKRKDTKPRSWEEYCRNFKGQFYYIQDSRDNIATSFTPNGLISKYKNYVPLEELAESFLAMMQLMSLRQEWIEDWEPDWSKGNYCVAATNSGIFAGVLVNFTHPLSFPTQEMATDFMNTFKDLLEIAKPLI